MSDNRNKKPAIDEAVLDEAAPDINEPQTETTEEPQAEETEATSEETASVVEDTQETEDTQEETPAAEAEPKAPVVDEETQEQKDQRYREQQTEAQLQAAKNKAIIDKVDEAKNIPEPTPKELKAYVAGLGVDWDELTLFEQSMAKANYKSEKSLALITQATETTKKIDEWAKGVDTFIDTTIDKPEFVGLSGHEAEFRKFCMQESHRGADIQGLLLPAFLHNLPAPTKNKGSLFEKGGGGEKETKPGKITDADQARSLRETNPREYKRQLKAGKIEIEV